MRKITILICLLTALLCGCNNNVDKMILSGTVKGKAIDNITLKIDGKSYKAVVENGKFKFDAMKVTPNEAILMINDKTFPMFISNAKLIATINSDTLAYSTIKGSKSNDVYAKFLENQNKFFKEMRKLPPSEDAMKIWTKELKKQDAKTLKLIESNLTEPVAGYLLNKEFKSRMSLKELDTWYGKLPENMRNMPSGNVLKTYIANRKKIEQDKRYINFSAFTADGKKVAFSSILKENKLIILDFWASWCGPCRHEAKNLDRIYKKFHAKGLEICSLSIDEYKDKWLKALDEDKYPWINLRETPFKEDAPSKFYNVNAIPAIFIFNSNGDLLGQNVRGEDLAKFCKKFFAKK